MRLRTFLVGNSDLGFDQGKHAVCGPYWLGIQIRVLIRASTRSADLCGLVFGFRFGCWLCDWRCGAVFGTVALCLALWPCVWRCGPVIGAVAL